MDSVGRYKTVSSKDAVSNAKEVLSIENTQEYDTFLLKKVNEGLMHLWTLDQRGEYQKDFDVIDGQVCLPAGLDSLLGFVFLDDNDCPLYIGGFGAGITDKSFVTSRPFMRWGFRVLANDGGVLVFDSPTRLPSERVRLYWEGRLTDDCGLTLMHEMEERSAVAYACWRYAEKFPERYPRDLREGWKREYANQKKFLQANSIYNAYRQNRAKVQRIMSAYLVFQKFGLS
jgi:hypothetical protein